MVSFHGILSWRSYVFMDAGAVLRLRARVYEEVHEGLKNLLREEFLGVAAQAEARARRGLIDDAADIQKIYEQVSSRFFAVAESIDKLVKRAKRVHSSVRSNPMFEGIEDNGAITFNLPQTFDLPYGIERLRAPYESITTSCLSDAEAIVAYIRETYALLEGANKKARGTLFSVIHHGMRRPESTWSAEEVHSWWIALSLEEQDRILNEHPEWIGNLAGIPFRVRDLANRRRIKGLLKELEAEIEKVKKLRVDRFHHGFDIGGPESNAFQLKKWQDLQKKYRDLLAVQRKFSGKPDDYYTLVSLDIWAGDHLHAAVGLGDIDTAKHVMVHTPGMTSTVEGALVGKGTGWGSAVSGAQVVLDSARYQLTKQGHRINESVAAIVNLNYDAPQWGELFTEDSVAFSYQAQKGSMSGADMLNAVQATHQGDPHVVNSGHSYGSVFAGYAMQNSTAPDDFTAMGSPGITSMEHLSLGTVPGQVHIGEASGDPVADLGRFGGDPSWSKSFEQWGTGEWKGPDGITYKASSGHSQYMMEGSTSTYNLGSILIGDGIAVHQGGE